MSTAQLEPMPPKHPEYGPRRPWISYVAVIVAALGVWLSYDLTRLSLNARASNPLVAAQCDPQTNADAGCGAVLHSRWASIPLGRQPGAPRLPVSVLGMGYFLVLGAWHLLVGPPRHRGRAWMILPLVAAAAGAWESIRLTQVMARELNQWCVVCIEAHVVNGLLILLTLAAFPLRRPSAAEPAYPTGRHAAAAILAGAAAALIVLVATLLVLNNRTFQQYRNAYETIVNDPQFVLWQFSRQERVDLAIDPARSFVGALGAPHHIVAFTDLQCSACARAHAALREVYAAHADEVCIQFRHYPLDPACNERLQVNMHPLACRAAQWVEQIEIAGGAEAAREFRDRCYEHQESIGEQAFSAWTAEAGIAVSDLETGAAAAGQRVADDIALADQLGVNTAPVLFLDGRRMETWSNLKAWDALLAPQDAQPADATDPNG